MLDCVAASMHVFYHIVILILHLIRLWHFTWVHICTTYIFALNVPCSGCSEIASTVCFESWAYPNNRTTYHIMLRIWKIFSFPLHSKHYMHGAYRKLSFTLRPEPIFIWIAAEPMPRRTLPLCIITQDIIAPANFTICTFKWIHLLMYALLYMWHSSSLVWCGLNMVFAEIYTIQFSFFIMFCSLSLL